MSITTTETETLIEGAFYFYDRTTSHAKEGIAEAVRDSDGVLNLLDTFWYSQPNRVSKDEALTARLWFDPNDGEWVELNSHTAVNLKNSNGAYYSQDDYRIVTAQHGLTVLAGYLRVGAEPSLDAILESARNSVAEAERALASRKRDLERAEAEYKAGLYHIIKP